MNIAEERQSIGGFFGLDLPMVDNFPQDHGSRSVMLNSGRCALEYILRSLGEVSRIYVPYYTCATVLEPLNRLGISPSFYRIDGRFEIDEPCFPKLEEGEFLIYTNYFGLKQSYVDKLSVRLCGHLIVDNCLALYSDVPSGVPGIYSPRKWSGLADGGVAVLDAPSSEALEIDESWSAACYLLRCLERGVEDSSHDCEQSEARLIQSPLMYMSRLTQRMIKGIDYQKAAEKRRENFACLHEKLGLLNKWEIHFNIECVPFCYPFWTNLPGLRDHLIDHGILIPVFWEELPAPVPVGGVERSLVSGMLPLPVDQRYSTDDMRKVLDVIDAFYL